MVWVVQDVHQMLYIREYMMLEPPMPTISNCILKSDLYLQALLWKELKWMKLIWAIL
jgi:hypothetical protein